MAISLAHFMGGAHELTIAADTVISAGNARVWEVTASGAGLKVKLELPASWIYRTGFPQVYVRNAGGTNDFELATNDGTVFATVAVGETAQVGLSSLTGQGTWTAKVA